MTNNIKSILNKKGISQIWLATELGVTQETVSLWCRNKHQPSIMAIKIIAIILGVEYNSLINK